MVFRPAQACFCARRRRQAFYFGALKILRFDEHRFTLAMLVQGLRL
jgi:hypothetical protein